MQQVEWVKCRGNQWCLFWGVDLSSIQEGQVGVYVIWEPSTRTAVYVGSGAIASRIAEHRDNPSFVRHLAHTWEGLLVSWAPIPDRATRLRVERYVANQYNPKLGGRHPDVAPLEVNLLGS